MLHQNIEAIKKKWFWSDCVFFYNLINVKLMHSGKVFLLKGNCSVVMSVLLLTAAIISWMFPNIYFWTYYIIRTSAVQHNEIFVYVMREHMF